MRIKGIVLGLGLAVVTLTGRVEAQARFGANVSWGTDTHFGLGARVGFGLGELTKKSKIEGQATADFFFPSGVNFWEATGNALYKVSTSGSVAPYVGAGLGFRYASYKANYNTQAARSSRRPAFSVTRLDTISGSNSDFFLNLLGGLRFKPAGNLQPFAEARVEIGSGSQLVLSGGVFFGH